MPRSPRNDEPGAWHHVFNRGIARRTVFETERDIRQFLSLFARCARAGEVEVHAYCVLSTHFHFLLRSPTARLSAAMQWIQNQYVRWFNRGRRRDGPLLRGRFGSKRADSLTYRRHLVRYIDFNAVRAGIAAAPALYRHGSASQYARASGPPWLTRSWVEGAIGESGDGSRGRVLRYADCFGEPLPPALLAWVEQRAASTKNELDGLDDLIAAAPERVADWMRRKASLADGSRVGLPLCTPDSLARALQVLRTTRGDWRIELGRKTACAYSLLHVGLLRDLCAATLDSAANATNLAVTSAWNAAQYHAALMATDADYAQIAGRLASAALRECHSPPSLASATTGGSREELLWVSSRKTKPPPPIQHH